MLGVSMSQTLPGTKLGQTIICYLNSVLCVPCPVQDQISQREGLSEWVSGHAVFLSQRSEF